MKAIATIDLSPEIQKGDEVPANKASTLVRAGAAKWVKPRKKAEDE